ncbi:MAG: CDP-glycerol--poly(glycerophosphate) glycerophosphotransferase [Rikenellaceae bacterium]
MGKRYLFFVTLEYSYSILRPLQEEILSRGDQVAWFIESGCKDLLTADEKRIHTIAEVMKYNPLAIFAPGNHIYDFFPGVKVYVTHGYPIYKRAGEAETHFKIRGWFDIYCTSGESSSPMFEKIEARNGSFKYYETGWCKADPLATCKKIKVDNERVKIIYSTTFTKGITAAPILFDTIQDMVARREWDWVISFHPKFNDSTTIDKYKALAAECDNVEYITDGIITAELLNGADVMLCDSSSIITEFLLLGKRAVTFCNTAPGKHLLNVTSPQEVEAALERAISAEAPLLSDIEAYTHYHEAHLDGKNSARILDAVDDFVANFQGTLKAKKAGFVRRYKLRRKCGFTPWQAIANILGHNNLNQIKLK